MVPIPAAGAVPDAFSTWFWRSFLPLAIAACAATTLAVLVIIARQVSPTDDRLAEGMSVPDIDVPLTPEAGKRSLVFVLSERCGFCLESLPEVREVARTVNQMDLPVRLISLTYDELNEYEAYLRRNHLGDAMDVYSVSSVSPLTNVTPRVLLLDGRGVVVRDWVGLISEQRRMDIVEALTKEVDVAASRNPPHR